MYVTYVKWNVNGYKIVIIAVLTSYLNVMNTTTCAYDELTKNKHHFQSKKLLKNVYFYKSQRIF